LENAPAVKDLLVVDIVARAVSSQLKQEMYEDATKAKEVYTAHSNALPAHLERYYANVTDNFGTFITKQEVEDVLAKKKDHLLLRVRELTGIDEKNEFQTVFKFPKLTPFLDTLKMQQEGRLADAEKMYLHELELKEAKCKSNPLSLVPVLKDLMILYKMWGRVKFQHSDAAIRRVLKIQEDTLGPNHLDCATTIVDICTLHGYFGDYSDDDEELRKRAIAIRTEMLGLNHPDTAEAIYWLGGLYYAVRRYEEAAPKFIQAIEIYEKTLGPHPKTADAINEFARLYYDQAKYDQAEPLFKRAVEMREEVLGLTHPMTAQAISNLGAVNQVLNRYDEAERLYKRALEIKEEAMGPNHPETASTINNIGLLTEHRGNPQEALKYYERALAIYVEAFGEKAWYTNDTRKHLTRVKKNLGLS
jgi:tetratricopeptide (TPR) repeat protein